MTTEHLIGFARAVRHEANNLLAAIGGTAELMHRSAMSERDAARAERLREASARLEALLRAYLSLAAPPADDTPPAAVLEAMHPLFVLILGPGREVTIDAAADIPPLGVPPGELQASALSLASEAAAQARPGSGLHIALARSPGGALLTVAPQPGGAAPLPLFLPGAEP
jgi:signal transduction histidine kinase